MSSIREAQRLAALEARIAKLEARLSEAAPRLDFDRSRAGSTRLRSDRASIALRAGRKETPDHA